MKFIRKKSKSKVSFGFTLVELIVVITILVILGTIAFTSISGFSSNARDTSRASDISNLTKSLDIVHIKMSSYPIPDNVFAITYSGGVLWDQGTIGDTVIRVISAGGVKLSKKPTDPLNNVQEYIYSRLAYGNAYQLKTDWEGDSISYKNFPQTLSVDSAFAANSDPTISYIKGNYGGVVAKTQTGSTICILALPSIIVNTGSASTPVIVLETNNLLSGSLLLHRGNLTGILFKPSLTGDGSPVVYCSGALPSTTAEKILFASGIANAYSGTSLATSSQIQPFIAALMSNNTTALGNLGGGVLTSLGGGVTVPAAPVAGATNCVGSWGTCSVSCTQTYIITTPASDGGLACTNLNNDSQSCAGGSCPAPGSCDNTGINSCVIGTPINQVAGSCGGSATWNCTTAGGTSVQCSKANAACINGVCNAVFNAYTTPIPTCSSGTPTVVSGTGPWTWGCNSSNGGTNTTAAACSANKSINGVCNNTTNFACSAGTSVSNVAGVCGGSATWTCNGINGGTNSVQCSKANAACIYTYSWIATANLSMDPEFGGFGPVVCRRSDGTDIKNGNVLFASSAYTAGQTVISGSFYDPTWSYAIACP